MTLLKKPKHKYPTKFSSLNYTFRTYSFTNSRFDFQFLSKDQKLWNEILKKKEKRLESHVLFKN